MKPLISSLCDDELVELMQAGDRRALDEIYHRNAGFLYRYASKRLNSLNITDDLIQDLFVKIWIRKNELQIKSELRPYLVLCLRNIILDHYKKLQVQNRYMQLEGQLFKDYDNATQDHLLYKDSYQAVKTTIDSLPDKMQRVFYLRRVSELSIDEIASEMNISRQTVKNQLGLALKRLKVSLGSFLSLLPLIFFLSNK